MSQNKNTERSFLARFQDKEYREKLLYTFWIAVALFVQGLVIGQVGPTFLDIQIITGTDVTQASVFFTANSCGFISGAAILALIEHKMNKTLLIGLSLLGLGTVVILTPYCSLFAGMVIVKVFEGMFNGFIGATGSAENMRVWGNEGRAFLQVLHCGTAIGAVISPLYMSPFLAKRRDISSSDTWANSTSTEWLSSTIILNGSESTANMTLLSQPLSDDIGKNISLIGANTKETNIHYGYLISGSLVIIASIPFLYRFICRRTKDENQSNSNDGESNADKRILPKLAHLGLCLGLYLFYFCVVSVEVTFFSFLMTFVILEFTTVSKQQGAYLIAIYWFTFAGARFCMIFAAGKISPTKLISFCMTIAVISISGFVVAAHLHSITLITVVTSAIGIGMSALFPSGFSWCESRLLHVTPRVSAGIIISGSIGAMLTPLLLGYLMEELSNMWFCYILLAGTFLMIFVFISVNVLNNILVVKKYGELHKQNVSVVTEKMLKVSSYKDGRESVLV